MMDTTNAAVLTGVVVTTGRWAENQKLEMRVVVGSAFLALGLAALSSVNDKLARNFGVLILVAAVFRYALPIIQKTGIVKVPPPKPSAGMGGGGSRSGSW